MDKEKFASITRPLLKFSRIKDRYYIDPNQVGVNLCDLCLKFTRSPGWDLYPWKLWSRRPSVKIVCKRCRASQHIPLIRSEENSDVNLEKTQI